MGLHLPYIGLVLYAFRTCFAGVICKHDSRKSLPAKEKTTGRPREFFSRQPCAGEDIYSGMVAALPGRASLPVVDTSTAWRWTGAAPETPEKTRKREQALRLFELK